MYINLKIYADAGVALVSTVKYAISIKVSKDSMLIGAHASTVYAVGRIKSKTKQDLPRLHPP
jgi:hypothetical protein